MKVAAPLPSAEAQLAFLVKLQRLFAEGDFTATYKFALLIALADLAVELGADDGSELEFSTRQIADRFIYLYWRHASPYGRAGSEPVVLIQNIGRQAAVLKDIGDFQAKTGAGNLLKARGLPQYKALLSKVASTVSTQPLNYLQNFGGATDPFIYEREGLRKVRLKPGVAYFLRRFYPLVQQLSRSHWVDHIKSNRRNHPILGAADDLADFLFSTSRQSLQLVCEGLRKLDGSSCFYCGQPVSEIDVDHYIPFSLYPRDIAHNFVLAHPGCNRSKSDTLAGRPHLERWLERLSKRTDDLAEIGAVSGIAADQGAIRSVAACAYSNARLSGARAWFSPARYQLVGDEYLGLFDTPDQETGLAAAMRQAC